MTRTRMTKTAETRMGIISFFFTRNIDVFEAFGLNASAKDKEVKIRFRTNEGSDKIDGHKVEVTIDGNVEEVTVTESQSYPQERILVKVLVALTVTILVLR